MTRKSLTASAALIALAVAGTAVAQTPNQHQHETPPAQSAPGGRDHHMESMGEMMRRMMPMMEAMRTATPEQRARMMEDMRGMMRQMMPMMQEMMQAPAQR
jgi:Spy/CpxP family protein refolding chaperone